MDLSWARSFADDIWYCWHLAGAEIYIRRLKDYRQACCKPIYWKDRSGTCTGPVRQSPPPDVLLQSAVNQESICALLPGLPEKPFLLSMGAMRLLPDAELCLNLELPLIYRFVSQKNIHSAEQPEVLFTFYPYMLKNTWFGQTTTSGKHCYALPLEFPLPDCSCPLRENALQENEAQNSKPDLQYSVKCSFTIHNKSKTEIDLDKIRLDSEAFSVYFANNTLKSDKAVLDINGNDYKLTIIEEEGQCLTPANKWGMEKTIIKKSRKFIRDIVRYK